MSELTLRRMVWIAGNLIIVDPTGSDAFANFTTAQFGVRVAGPPSQEVHTAVAAIVLLAPAPPLTAIAELKMVITH